MAGSQSDRQNRENYFSSNFLVFIKSTFNGVVVGRLPEEISMQLSSEWDTPLLSSGVSPVEVLLQEGLGKSTKTQLASAQVWSGSAPIDITIPLEFYADKDPRKEVIQPIINLTKMALPRKSGDTKGGLFTPPGPRIFRKNTRKFSKLSDLINIDIGNFMNFNKVIITSVNPTFTTRDMTQNGKPLKSSCEITFRTMFSLTGDDFETMFKK
jgi:hypothetical protein